MLWNLVLLVSPLATNAQLSNKRVDALLDAIIYNFDPTKARHLDSICTAEAMKCLSGYSFNPSFLDPAHAAAIRGIREKIHQLQFSINEQLDIVVKNNLNFDVSKTPGGFRCMELQEIINRHREEVKHRRNLSSIRRPALWTKGKGRSQQILSVHLFLKMKSKKFFLL